MAKDANAQAHINAGRAGRLLHEVSIANEQRHTQNEVEERLVNIKVTGEGGTN